MSERARLGTAASIAHAIAAIPLSSGTTDASLIIDLRATSVSGSAVIINNGKNVIGLQQNATLMMNIWAQVTGSDPSKPQCIQSFMGSFLSSAGGILGHLSAQIPSAPFAAPGFSRGLQTDLDGDGDLDVGSQNAASSLNFYSARSGALLGARSNNLDGSPLTGFISSPIPNGTEYLIGTLRFPAESVGVKSPGAEINFRPRTTHDSAVWVENANEIADYIDTNGDGVPDATHYTYSGGTPMAPDTGFFAAGSPVRIDPRSPGFWTGIAGDFQWGSANNWLGQVVPTSATVVDFENAPGTVNLGGSNRFAKSVRFENNSGGFVLSNGTLSVTTFLDHIRDGQSTLSVNLTVGAELYVTHGKLTLGGSVSDVVATLSVSDSSLVVSPGGDRLLKVGSPTISFSGFLDLNDNDMQIRSTASSYAQIANLVARARNGGLWDGSGITSSIARNANPHVTTLGVLTGQQFHQAQGATATFDGSAVANSHVLVKYTYYGDTDFNGKVDGADYARIDTTFNNELTQGDIAGWFNGDFDYNNKVDGADYALIDSAFNAQNGTLLRMLQFLDGTNRDRSDMTSPGLRMALAHFDQFGDGYVFAVLNSIPEPTSSLVFAGLGALVATFQRRRRR